MLVIVRDEYESVSKTAAQLLAGKIRRKPNLVLGLATGSTPLGLYKELIRMHEEDDLDFSNVVTFNLDEYIGLPPEHDQSYYYFMKENLFDHININLSNVHVPKGMFGEIEINDLYVDPKIDEFCQWYENRISHFGGIDVQVLGIGSNGHIAFNEPGSSLGSRTRVKTLTKLTKVDNSRFFEKMEDVPRYAITMGIGTIMDAKEIIMLASGEGKADAVSASVEGPITAMCPASMLQIHRKSFIIIDSPAASKLAAEFVTYS